MYRPKTPEDAATSIFVAASFSLRSCDEEVDQAQAKACGYKEQLQRCAYYTFTSCASSGVLGNRSKFQ